MLGEVRKIFEEEANKIGAKIAYSAAESKKIVEEIVNKGNLSLP